MRQIVLTEPGRFAEQTAGAPTKPRDGYALMRMERIGVCGSDFSAFAGSHPAYTYPRVLGHELSGTVAGIAGNTKDLKIGDRCAIEPYVPCGACRPCRLGRTNCCEALQVFGIHVDGGMKGFLEVLLRLLHKSDRLSTDQLALVETLGIGAHAVVRSELAEGEEALVVGAGPIGLAVMQFARAAGARVTVLERSRDRRQFAEGFADRVLAEADSSLRGDIVFDATGNARAMAASLELVAAGGRLVYVGITRDPVPLDDALFHRREITLLASRNSAGVFPRIIQAIEKGRIDTAPWITERLRLRDVPAHFPALTKQPGLVKALIEVEEADL